MFSFFVSFLQRSILTPARLWFPPVTGDESSGSVTVAQDVFLCRLRPRLSILDHTNPSRDYDSEINAKTGAGPRKEYVNDSLQFCVSVFFSALGFFVDSLPRRTCYSHSTSQTCVNNLLRPTQLTLYLAAPVERAGAPFHHDHFLRPVAPAAAHQIAPVDADRRVVTLAAVRSLDAEPGVPLAKPRRRFQIDQVLHARRFVVRVVGF